MQSDEINKSRGLSWRPSVAKVFQSNCLWTVLFFMSWEGGIEERCKIPPWSQKYLLLKPFGERRWGTMGRSIWSSAKVTLYALSLESFLRLVGSHCRNKSFNLFLLSWNTLKSKKKQFPQRNQQKSNQSPLGKGYPLSTFQSPSIWFVSLSVKIEVCSVAHSPGARQLLC